LRYGEFKAPKGIIKVELELNNNIISYISITGDFFMYPEDALKALEQNLIGVKMEREILREVIEKFYKTTLVQTPMLKPEHWVEAIMRTLGS